MQFTADSNQFLLLVDTSCIMYMVAAGNCGDSGRLDKAQADLLKRYQTRLHLFDKPEVQQRALNFVQSVVRPHHDSTGSA